MMSNIWKLKIGLTTILITFGIGVSAWLFYNSSYFQPPRVEIPTVMQEKEYSKYLDEITDPAGLQKLREKRLPIEDVEIRIWMFRGLENTEGVILRKNSGIWRVYYVKANNYSKPTKATSQQLLKVPINGWQSFNEEIFSLGITELPDVTKTTCDPNSIIDGSGYIVEVYENYSYRVYNYKKHSLNECNEGIKMKKIIDLIKKEILRR